MVQALAGLAAAGQGSEYLEQAIDLFDRRTEFRFNRLWACSDDFTLLDVALAA